MGNVRALGSEESQGMPETRNRGKKEAGRRIYNRVESETDDK